MAAQSESGMMMTAEEEEALKRNVDCVYFLASPLTCKKGAECEYRHSEIARVNPRDCWYWLNGSCLNPKCAFRHPPLEGMLGPQVPVSSGPTLQPSQITVTPVSSVSHHSSGKQCVPCIFFQKGFCLKGDRCPFSHGANNIKFTQGPLAASTAFPEPSTIQKPFAGLERCTSEPRIVEAYIPPKPTKVPFQAKSPSEAAPSKNESTSERHASRLDDDACKHRLTPAANENLCSRTNRVHQVHSPEDYDAINSDDAEEISRELSPGFDVLVDDELRGSDYYLEENRHERKRGNADRGLTPVSDYDIGHSGDYKDYDSLGDNDQDTYRGSRYDSFDHTRAQYGRDKRRVSSERTFGVSERMRYPRGDNPDHINGLDLRNRLLKHRKANGLRSVISHDRDQDGGNQSYRGSSRRGAHHVAASEKVVSDRLRGRIKLPERSISPLHESYLHRDIDRGRGNSRGRLSPARSHGFGHQGGRLQDRIKGRVHEDTDDGRRDFGGPLTREMLYENKMNFEGPKRLSQLRGKKSDEYIKKPVYGDHQGLPLGKRKYSESYQQAQNNASFEGPKPLVEILKKKRGGGNGEETNGRSKGGKEQGEDSKATDERTLERNASDFQMEEGLIVDDEGEDQEHEEAYAEDEGEYEYEQVEGEDFKEDEAENVEGEYAEDDDADDFAKKIGIMFS